jgi:hypothetical protein
MYITSFFTENGSPATGLNPTINAWTMNGTQVIVNQSMSEIAGGFYVYDFSTYDFTEDYVFRAEDLSLPLSERYVIASNENDSLNSQGVIKQILGLVQGNFIISSQVYDSNNNLTSATVKTYDDNVDLDLDLPLHTYTVTATYDSEGRLTGYTSKED